MRILCATDLLSKSEPAIERAGMLVRRLVSDLCIVHVVESAPSEDRARAELARIRSRLCSGRGTETERIAPSILLRTGNAAEHLCEIVRQYAPDLVVVGPRSRGSIRGWMGDALAQRVLNLRLSPVLIVQQPAIANYRRVLLALDLSATAREIVRVAESVVLGSDTCASIVHAFEPRYGAAPYLVGAIESVGAANSTEKREAEGAMRKLVSEKSELDYELILSAVFPADAIVGTVKRIQPELLVVGTGGGGRLRRALLGSTASAVLDRVSCDVLVVPQGSVQPRRPAVVWESSVVDKLAAGNGAVSTTPQGAQRADPG